jgi:predicted dehydrogenase
VVRYLIGEVATVSGKAKTFNNKRPDRKGTLQDTPADELDAALIEFENGCVGILEASAISTGRKNFLSWEISGSRGSLAFNLEDLNHLQVYLDGGAMEEVKGFSNVSVTESLHPYFHMAWAPGHNIGWENAIIYELFHFIDAVANDKPIGPDAATFEDGYKVQYLMELIKQSSREGRRLEVDYKL